MVELCGKAKLVSWNYHRDHGNWLDCKARQTISISTKYIFILIENRKSYVLCVVFNVIINRAFHDITFSIIFSKPVVHKLFSTSAREQAYVCVKIWYIPNYQIIHNVLAANSVPPFSHCFPFSTHLEAFAAKWVTTTTTMQATAITTTKNAFKSSLPRASRKESPPAFNVCYVCEAQ